MSASIPKVRRWRVRYFKGKTCLANIAVDAPTRLFALWAAQDIANKKRLYLSADRRTISPMWQPRLLS